MIPRKMGPKKGPNLGPILDPDHVTDPIPNQNLDRDLVQEMIKCKKRHHKFISLPFHVKILLFLKIFEEIFKRYSCASICIICMFQNFWENVPATLNDITYIEILLSLWLKKIFFLPTRD